MDLFSAIAMMIVSAIVQYALRPRPEDPVAATIDNVDAPTAEEGSPIPVVFGTVWLSSPNVLWYGDMTTEPIKKEGGKK